MSKTNLKFLSLWAINDRLELESLKAQLDELKVTGLEGVIFHPRFYPNVPVYMSPEYLAIVSELILYASEIEMAFWIYDENGWPSGTASGQVFARNPLLNFQWIEWTLSGAAPSDTVRLSNYTAAEGEQYEVSLHTKSGVSSLDADATALFIELTHEAYRTGLDPAAFDYVTGFFSDEVAFLDGHSVTFQFGGIPWCESFTQQYEERYGEALLPQLSLLFVEGEGAAQIRARYWELLTDALIDGFYKPIADWCEANDKLFTAHLKAEENPFFQLIYSGSGFQVLKGISMPALDALERNPGNHFYPRMVHSISVQQGRAGTLVEAMGGAGWGASPESFKNYVLWLASHGVDHFIMHLNQYRLSLHAMHDWPPSIPCHLTWKESFPAVLQNIKEAAAALPDLRSSEPELLIVTPTRGVMGTFTPAEADEINEHDGSNLPDTISARISSRFIEFVDRIYAAGIHYELTEERILEEAAIIADGLIQIGKRQYRKVLIADGCLWSDNNSNSSVVEKIKAAGIEVVFEADMNALLHVERTNRDKVSKTEQSAELPFIQSEWQVEWPQQNQLLIELQPAGPSKQTASIHIEEAGKLGELTLLVLDPVEAVHLNGQLLSCKTRNGNYEFVIPSAAWSLDKLQTFDIELGDQQEPNAVVFLQGEFAVRSESTYLDKDDRQLATKGPFVVTEQQHLKGLDLVAEGLPFCGSAVRATKELSLDEAQPNSLLHLTGVRADAVHVFIDNEELGWCFEPDMRISLPSGLSEGVHQLVLNIVPSTYNSYGPHRYYEGDRHLTSPNQYSGVKNFADRPDAPEATLGDSWHFVKWQVAGDVVIS